MDIFNILPMSDQRYNAAMKKLTNTFKFEDNNVAAFRMQVLEHGKKFGWESACNAFNISKATYFRWQKALSNGGLSSLIPKSTRPITTRRSQIHPLIVDYIKELRHDCGNIGSIKLKDFIDNYARQMGIDTISPRSIDRIIAKYNFYTPPKKHKVKDRKTPEYRSKYAPKVGDPGFVEVDCITMYSWCKRFQFICCIDVYSRLAYVEQVSGLTATNATSVLRNCQADFPFPVITVQTDNGSEFLKDFDQYLDNSSIPHYFTLPHSPRINGIVERFNRTIQEEFLNLTELDILCSSTLHFRA